MIETVLFDIDGVLTDGTVAIDSSGKEIKQLCFDDIDAIFELKRRGIKIGFITGERNEFSKYIDQRFEPDYFIDGCKNKLGAFQELEQSSGLVAEKTAFIGDSRKDSELLSYVARSFAPSDADDEARSNAKCILRSKRGKGVVREMVDYILNDKMTGSRKKSACDTEHLFWGEKIREHAEIIENIRNDSVLMKKMGEVGDLLIKVFRSGNKLLICGNGGSAADSQHIATEFVSKFYKERKTINAEALTVNTSTITAIGNDYEFQKIFARQVEAKGSRGDVLLAISTSGNAKNISEAIDAGIKCGMETVVLTGAGKNSLICKNADYCLNVPSFDAPRIQEAHILIGHMLCEYVERTMYHGS